MQIPSNVPGSMPHQGFAQLRQNRQLQELTSDSVNLESRTTEPLREAFRDFVGTTLFGQMLSSMRETVGKPAYFHGGRTEEIFQQQLDEIMVDDLTKNSAAKIADPMFELFQLRRS